MKKYTFAVWSFGELAGVVSTDTFNEAITQTLNAIIDHLAVDNVTISPNDEIRGILQLDSPSATDNYSFRVFIKELITVESQVELTPVSIYS